MDINNKKEFYNRLKDTSQQLSSIEKSININSRKTEKSKQEIINNLHEYFYIKEYMLNEPKLYESNPNILLKPWKNDLTLEIAWEKISLLEEYRDFTKLDISVSFGYVQWPWVKMQNFGHSPKWYLQNYIQNNPDNETEILKSFYVTTIDELKDHTISVPTKALVGSSSYTLAAITHELGHIFADHLWKNLVEHERNANAFSIRFIKHIEQKYNIKTHVLENDLYKVALASYQLRYLLHQHDPHFLEKHDNRYNIHQNHKYDELQKQTERDFI